MIPQPKEFINRGSTLVEAETEINDTIKINFLHRMIREYRSHIEASRVQKRNPVAVA
jgi:hypothetical protein